MFILKSFTTDFSASSFVRTFPVASYLEEVWCSLWFVDPEQEWLHETHAISWQSVHTSNCHVPRSKQVCGIGGKCVSVRHHPATEQYLGRSVVRRTRVKVRVWRQRKRQFITAVFVVYILHSLALKWTFPWLVWFVTYWRSGKGVVVRERVGTVFPHLFHVFL